MEITYSEDVVIRNETLLATLSVFCDKIYLPYPNVAQDVKAYLFRTGSAQFPSIQRIVKAIDSDPQKAFVDNWNLQHAVLFKEGVLQYLPPLVNYSESIPEPIHRLEDTGDHESTIDIHFKRQKQINLHKKGVYTVMALTDHLQRDDLPGYEFFEGSRHYSEITLSRDIFFLELPEIMTDCRNILELRKFAQNAGISEFWAMIKEQTAYANANSEASLSRAEKVRKEFDKWCDDRWKFRAKNLTVIGSVTFAFVYSNYGPAVLAGILGSNWIGELNQKWAQRKNIENKAFKFISRVHGKIRELKNP